MTVHHPNKQGYAIKRKYLYGVLRGEWPNSRLKVAGLLENMSVIEYNDG